MFRHLHALSTVFFWFFHAGMGQDGLSLSPVTGVLNSPDALCLIGSSELLFFRPFFVQTLFLWTCPSCTQCSGGFGTMSLEFPLLGTQRNGWLSAPFSLPCHTNVGPSPCIVEYSRWRPIVFRLRSRSRSLPLNTLSSRAGASSVRLRCNCNDRIYCWVFFALRTWSSSIIFSGGVFPHATLNPF